MKRLDFFTNPQIEGHPLQGALLGAGKDATAYELGFDLVYRQGHPNAHLSDPDNATLIMQRLDEEVTLHRELPKDVAMARTVMAWLDAGRVHKIIERAEGRPIFASYPPETLIPMETIRSNWATGIHCAATIPQHHYDKAVADEQELRKREIFVDYLGNENLLYGPNGFSFIDTEYRPLFPLRGVALYTAFIDANMLTTILGQGRPWQDCISEECRQATITVLEKLFAAGHVPRYRLLFKMICERLDYRPPVYNEISNED